MSNLRSFHYTKSSGDESDRVVYPLRHVDDKLMAIDLTQYPEEERLKYEAELDHIHKEYIRMIKDAGLGAHFRYFFLDQMS